MNVKELIDTLNELGLPLDTEIAFDSDDCVGLIAGYRVVTDMTTGDTIIAMQTDRDAVDVEDHPGFE